MANYVILGAGASGLYTAYRLLTGGTLQTEDTVQLYEWADRVGGRILTFTFPEAIGGDSGLYCEFGGMRFAVDKQFPGSITEGHVLVQNTIVAMGLETSVLPFVESDDRMYYLRGMNLYASWFTSSAAMPYFFNAEFTNFVTPILNSDNPILTADAVLSQIATAFGPTGIVGSNTDRPLWCNYYASGTVLSGSATPTFPTGTLVQNIGYWNLLYDQLGDEGYDYCADGNGYTSNVINWNAADAMQANNDYGSSTSYMRLDGGYSTLFDTLHQTIVALMADRVAGSGVYLQTQAIRLEENPETAQTTVYFSEIPPVVADVLFLAMPRRSLELIAANCATDYMLNQPQVRWYLESSIDQPAVKAVMVFDQAWWAQSQGICTWWPRLHPLGSAPDTQWVGGPTITDLPLRMVYYFGNNVPTGPGPSGGPYVLLASYDDMGYANFWGELETSGDYTQAPSSLNQPLTGPTSVDVSGPLAQTLLKQLAEAHGASLANVPAPLAVYYQDWGQNPFGGGYHGWSAHYNICQVMQNIRAPYQTILNNGDYQTYIVGSCYSFDQAWVEGAFCTAESVLQDYLSLPPPPNFVGVSNYQLICKV